MSASSTLHPTAVKPTFHWYSQQRSLNLGEPTAVHFNPYSKYEAIPHTHRLLLPFEHDIQAAALVVLFLQLSNSFVCMNSTHVYCFNCPLPNANQPCILQGTERKLVKLNHWLPVVVISTSLDLLDSLFNSSSSV